MTNARAVIFHTCIHWGKSFSASGVTRGSVIKCLTRNQEVLASSFTGLSVFFPRSVLRQYTSYSQPSTRKDMNNLSCIRDMTEILLKHHKIPFSQSILCGAKVKATCKGHIFQKSSTLALNFE